MPCHAMQIAFSAPTKSCLTSLCITNGAADIPKKCESEVDVLDCCLRKLCALLRAERLHSVRTAALAVEQCTQVLMRAVCLDISIIDLQ